MTSHERVLTACAFQRPDRIPRFDNFWSYPDCWRARLGPPELLTDMAIWYPDETPWPTRTRRLREEGEYVYEVDSWGRTVRGRTGAFFVETLQAAVSDGQSLDRIVFDSPQLDFRDLTGKMAPSVSFAIEAEARRIIDLGREGGVVIGTHSVSPEISLENFMAYHECCLKYGDFS